MTRLPRRLGRFSPLRPREPPAGSPGRLSPPQDTLPDEDSLTVPASGPDAAAGSRGGDSAAAAGVPVEAAIAAALAAPGIDAVTRVHLDEARGRLAARHSDAAEGLAGPTLSEALFTFVMPRLQHPEVLGAEQQFGILEQLAGELTGQEGDTVVREGALVVHRELRRLALLRQHCSSLIEG